MPILLGLSASAALACAISAHSRTHRARDQRTLLTVCSFAPVLTGLELVFFYKYGLFEASENDFIDDLIGVLVDSLIDTFGDAACESAEFFLVLYQRPDGIFHVLAVVNTLTHAAHRPARLRTCY